MTKDSSRRGRWSAGIAAVVFGVMVVVVLLPRSSVEDDRLDPIAAAPIGEADVRRDAPLATPTTSRDAQALDATGATPGDGLVGCSLHVTVEAPLALAEIPLHVLREDGPPERLDADPDGIFRFAFTPFCRVRASLPGRAAHVLEIPSPGHHRMHLDWARTSSRLLVDGEAPGHPVALLIQAEAGERSWDEIERDMTHGSHSLDPRVVTAPDGTFALPAALQDADLRVQLPFDLAFPRTSKPGSSTRVVRAEPDHTAGLVLHVTRHPTVTGRIVDAAGRGVFGVLVDADPDAADHAPMAHVNPVRTDGDGRFRLGLPGFEGATTSLRVTYCGLAANVPVVMGPTKIHDVGDIRLPLGGSLSLIVRDAEGETMRVHAAIEGSEQVFSGTTDATLVLSPVPAMPFSVVVAAPGRRSVRLEDCHPDTTRELGLERSALLRVRVVGPDASRPVGVSATAQFESRSAYERAVISAAQRRAQGYTDAFTNPHRSERTFTALARPEDGAVFGDLDGASTVHLRIARPGITEAAAKSIPWTGMDTEVVLDASACVAFALEIEDHRGEPFAGAVVAMKRNAGWFTCAADDAGRCELIADAGDRVVLAVQARGHPPVRREILAPRAGDIVRIALPAPRTIELRIVGHEVLVDRFHLGINDDHLFPGPRVVKVGGGRYRIQNPPDWPVKVGVGFGFFRRVDLLDLSHSAVIDASAARPVRIDVPDVEAFERPFLHHIVGDRRGGAEALASPIHLTAFEDGTHELVVAEEGGEAWRTSSRRRVVTVGPGTDTIIFD